MHFHRRVTDLVAVGSPSLRFAAATATVLATHTPPRSSLGHGVAPSARRPLPLHQDPHLQASKSSSIPFLSILRCVITPPTIGHVLSLSLVF